MRWRISGTRWRLAYSLQTLAEQLNSIWPEPGPTDGTVGDLSHQARRSDHNPNTAGVVTAIDVAEVVEDRGQALVKALVRARDPRIKYIIHEGQIWRSYARTGTTPWKPARYTGSNAHLSHVHISVSTTPTLYDDPQTWDLTGIGDTMAVLKKGDTGLTVQLYQRALLNWNPNLATDLEIDEFTADGAYGPHTEAAVKYYQRAAQLIVPFVANPDPYGQIGALTVANLARYVAAAT